MNIPESILSKLTDEQKAKAGAANSVEELVSVIKEFGIDLTDEQLEGLAGGTGPLDYPYLKTGPLGSCDPANETGPLGAVGPVGETGPLGSCDPANKTGPLGWYDK